MSSPPSRLVGSTVQHVYSPNSQTFCHPRVQALINPVFPELLQDNPSESSVVTHVGSNDIDRHQSEKLKDDFKTLIDTGLESGSLWMDFTSTEND